MKQPPLPDVLISQSARQAEIWSHRLEWIERGVLLLSVVAMAIHLGFHKLTALVDLEISAWILWSLTWLGTSTILRYRLSYDRLRFRLEQRSVAAIYLLWLLGLGTIIVAGADVSTFAEFWSDRWELAVRWSELVLALRLLVGGSETVRNLYLLGWSPALLLVLSFVILDLTGALLLLLPAARHPEAEALSPFSPALAALYTSTSACCVTGLVIVDTASYWTRTGQVIILCLIQVGGLGIMTFGGFVALFSGRAMQIGEGAMFRELFESDRVDSVRRMVISILLLTLGSELLGAILLWDLFPDQTWGDRIFYCVFHSVTAFCNAGFALTPNGANMIGLGHRWQVWGVMCALIIIGGLGFGTLHDSFRYAVGLLKVWRHRTNLITPRQARPRLGLNAALVLLTTAILLAGGTLALFVLDDGGAIGDLPVKQRLKAAWFHAVNCRTAGFNSVDLAALQPGTKLLMIILMFIGASPVSTGGGVKTASLAIAVLTFVAMLRGRPQVEIWGRSIPEPTVRRASLIIGAGALVVTTTTLLVTIFEKRGALFLDHLFEATSAFATVGASTVNSAHLTTPSLFAIIVTMFIGRVGPLTLFVAVGGRVLAARYEYPPEKVTLG